MVWDLFGLEKNPFELKAVEMGGIVPIETFYGREENREKLKQSIKNHNHSLNLIVGEKGAGKTSLGNVVRADLFTEYFTPLLEIDSQKEWNSKEFIQEALAVLYQSAQLSDTRTELSKKYLEVCQKIKQRIKPLFIDEEKSLGAQALGFGLEGSYGQSIKNQPYVFLKETFKQVVKSINDEGFAGLIIQFNNLDNLEIEDPKKLATLFSDLRDFLLTDNCHFIFLGNKIMEAGFKFNPKVNECINADFQLKPLNYSTIEKILKKRYDLFKIKGRIPIQPVTDDSVSLICKLFDGNIRQVFYSLDSAVIGAEEILRKIKPLTQDEVKNILYKLAKKRVEKNLQPRALEVLRFILKQKRDVTNTEITRELRLQPQNTSKYLGQLKNNNLIIIIDKSGRNIYYRTIHEAKWLLLEPTPGVQTSINQFGFPN